MTAAQVCRRPLSIVWHSLNELVWTLTKTLSWQQHNKHSHSIIIIINPRAYYYQKSQHVHCQNKAKFELQKFHSSNAIHQSVNAFTIHCILMNIFTAKWDEQFSAHEKINTDSNCHERLSYELTWNLCSVDKDF